MPRDLSFPTPPVGDLGGAHDNKVRNRPGQGNVILESIGRGPDSVTILIPVGTLPVAYQRNPVQGNRTARTRFCQCGSREWPKRRGSCRWAPSQHHRRGFGKPPGNILPAMGPTALSFRAPTPLSTGFRRDFSGTNAAVMCRVQQTTITVCSFKCVLPDNKIGLPGNGAPASPATAQWRRPASRNRPEVFQGNFPRRRLRQAPNCWATVGTACLSTHAR